MSDIDTGDLKTRIELIEKDVFPLCGNVASLLDRIEALEKQERELELIVSSTNGLRARIARLEAQDNVDKVAPQPGAWAHATTEPIGDAPLA